MRKSTCRLIQCILPLVLLCVVFLTPAVLRAETLDQVNDPAWTGGALNILPPGKVSQSFVPSLPVLTAVEVALQTGNKGRGGDRITVKILNAEGQQLATSTATLNEGFDGYWRVTMPGGGIGVTPGKPLTIIVQDGGKNVFWWKYKNGNTYPAGQAMYYGAAFKDNDFLFKTYGTKATPTFSLAITPDPVNITKGGSKQATITLTRQNGFAGPVTISFPTLPQGVSASPATQTISGNSGTCTFAASSAAPVGQYTATVKGVSGTLQPPPKNFQIKISAPANPCAQGLTLCGGLCVDMQKDTSNCGACNHACSANQKCSAGRCVTQAALCGGKTCADGEYCCQGACRKVGVGSCPYQGSSCEYYCPQDTSPCASGLGANNLSCCCGAYDGKIRSCPGTCK